MTKKEDFFPAEENIQIKRLKTQALNAMSHVKVGSARFGTVSRHRIDQQQSTDQHQSHFRDVVLIPAINAAFADGKVDAKEFRKNILNFAHPYLWPEVSPDYDAEIGTKLEGAIVNYADRVIAKLNEYLAKVPGVGASRSAA